MAQKSKQLRPKGYDFGKSGLTALVASPEFVEDLRKAQVVACSYGWEHSSELGHRLPLISLGAIHEEPLRRAFGEFRRWQQESKSEALDLTFVFLREGGYLLSISDRPESTARRLGRTSLVHERLLIGATYIKQFDTRDPSLQSFREYRTQRVIAPFLFGACVVSPTGPCAIDRSQIRRAAATEALLTFYADVVDESDAEATKGTAAWLALHVYRRDKSDVTTPPPPGPRDAFLRRAEIMNRHFAVTVERIRFLEPYTSIASHFERQGIRRWQVEQAVCNLVLSASLCDGSFHYVLIRTGHLRDLVAQTLTERFEEADSKALFKQIPPEEVILRQVELDASALLQAHGGDPRGASLPIIQQLLREKGLLDET